MPIKLPIKKTSPSAPLPAPAPANVPDAPTPESDVTGVPASPKKLVLRLPKKQPKPATLSALKTRIAKHPALTEKQQRDMVSALNGVAKAAGLPLSQIPTDVGNLRRILREAHPVRMGISRKRFSNMKSLLVRAMTLVGLVTRPPGREAHSAAWTAFLGQTPVKHQAWGLSRFAAYCSSREITPGDVTKTTFLEYERWLCTYLIDGDPVEAAHSAAKNFNAIIRRAELDRPLLDLRCRDRYLARSLETYPQSFQVDFERYLERLTNPDLFDETGIDAALKPTTLRNIRAHVRQLADAAVTAGYPPESFTSLADLVQVHILKAATGVIRARTGQDFSGTLHNILSTARNIAVHYVQLPPADLEQIAKAKAKVAKGSGYNNPHLTEKNQARLGQFADGENFKRLVLLPDQLMASANKAKGSPRAALDAIAAVAIGILLCCPMRAKNLANLDIQKHLIPTKKGKKTLYGVHVPKVEVKNRQDIDSGLSEPVSALVRDYLAHHHPVLASNSTALFPRPDGKPREPDKLAELVEARIHKWLGLTVHMHLFRHIAAMQYLEAYPGQYESVRRMLGHAKIDTTTGFYSPLSNKAIQEKYHEAVLAKALQPTIGTSKGKGKKP